MDSEDITRLLEKYWNCESSLEEEQQLREYFRRSDIPAQWKDASDLFRYFEGQKNRGLAQPSFDRELDDKLGHGKPKGKTVKLFYNLARIAAGVLVVVAATWLVRTEIRKSYPPEDTFSDPKMAFEETKKALMMISKGFGRGQKEATKINLFNEAEQKIEGKQQKKKEL